MIYRRLPSRVIMKYKLLEHTADALVEAYGSSLSERFENAAYALFDQITDVDAVMPVEERRVSVNAEEPEQLLVDFLQELLYLHDVEDLVLCEFHVEMHDDGLDAIVRGERFDGERHPKKAVVKAVAYHGLSLEDDKIIVLFDV